MVTAHCSPKCISSVGDIGQIHNSYPQVQLGEIHDWVFSNRMRAEVMRAQMWKAVPCSSTCEIC